MENKIFNKVIFEEIYSTNDFAKKYIKDKKPKNDFIVIAYSQTNGRGQFGRSFFSPKDSGVYFSVCMLKETILNLSIDLIQNTLTPKAAVAMRRVVKKIFNVELKIKWINDLYLNNKKVCGILTESINLTDAIIVGIGINIFNMNFVLEELKNTIGFVIEYEKLNKKNFFDKYKLDFCLDETKNKKTIFNFIVDEFANEFYNIFELEKIPKEYVIENISLQNIPVDFINKYVEN